MSADQPVRAGTGEPYTHQQPKIANRCPSCGGQSLFIGAGGWLTCSRLDCKQPCVSVAIEALHGEAPAAAGRERDRESLDEVARALRSVCRPVLAAELPWEDSTESAIIGWQRGAAWILSREASLRPESDRDREPELRRIARAYMDAVNTARMSGNFAEATTLGADLLDALAPAATGAPPETARYVPVRGDFGRAVAVPEARAGTPYHAVNTPHTTASGDETRIPASAPILPDGHGSEVVMDEKAREALAAPPELPPGYEIQVGRAVSRVRIAGERVSEEPNGIGCRDALNESAWAHYGRAAFGDRTLLREARELIDRMESKLDSDCDAELRDAASMLLRLEGL